MVSFYLCLGVCLRRKSWEAAANIVGRHFAVLLCSLIYWLFAYERSPAIDHIGINNSSYACGWTTCVRRGLPQTSRFALISHLRSHIGEKGSPTSRNLMMTLPLSTTMRDQVHPLVLEHLESFYILDFPIDQLTEHLVEMAIQSNPHRIALCNPLSSQVFLNNYDHILEMTLNILRRVFSLKKSLSAWIFWMTHFSALCATSRTCEKSKYYSHPPLLKRG